MRCCSPAGQRPSAAGYSGCSGARERKKGGKPTDWLGRTVQGTVGMTAGTVRWVLRAASKEAHLERTGCRGAGRSAVLWSAAFSEAFYRRSGGGAERRHRPGESADWARWPAALAARRARDRVSLAGCVRSLGSRLCTMILSRPAPSCTDNLSTSGL